MNGIWRALAATLLTFGLTVPTAANSYVIESPTHRQTFSYGSERHMAWMARGPDRRLALSAQFTNDPYVDEDNPRQYDDFIFDFPQVRLGADGRTFYYRAANGRMILVARRYHSLFGVDDIRLVEHARLVMTSPHGYLNCSLLLDDK